jgi:hypothetical protein
MGRNGTHMAEKKLQRISIPIYIGVFFIVLLGVHHLSYGAAVKMYQYLSEEVSPLLHYKASLDGYQEVTGLIDTGRVYRVRNIGFDFLAVEYSQSYHSSRLLPLFGSEAIADIYGRHNKPFVYDSRMLIKVFPDHFVCTAYSDALMRDLLAKLSSKSWAIEFKLHTNVGPRHASVIRGTSTPASKVPVVMAICTGATLRLNVTNQSAEAVGILSLAKHFYDIVGLEAPGLHEARYLP